MEDKLFLVHNLYPDIDIMGMCEVGRCVEQLPGYVRYGSTPVLGRGAGRGSGICAYVRASISHRVKKVFESPHQLWLRLVHNNAQDVYVAVIYVPPVNSPQWTANIADPRPYESVYNSICDNISLFQHQGHVLLLGDFNAHVSTAADLNMESIDLLTTVHAIPRTTFDADTTCIPPHRCSCDPHPVDTYGRLLLHEICMSTGCVLLNGRCAGDTAGHLTHTSSNFCPTRTCTVGSVLDYGVVTYGMYAHVSSFLVHPIIPVISDHTPVVCEFTIPATLPTRHTVDGTDCHTRLPRWDSSLQPVYAAYLDQPVMQQFLSTMQAQVQSGALHPSAALQQLTHALVADAASTVFGTTASGHSRHLPSGRLPKKWFKHCTHEWHQLKQAIRQGDTHAAAACRKKFNATKRRWKRYYNAQTAARMMDDLKHKPSKFWHGYKGVKAASTRLPFDMADVTSYWSTLFNAPNTGDLREVYGSVETLVHTLSSTSNAHADDMLAAATLNQPISPDEVLAALKALKSGKTHDMDGMFSEYMTGAWVIRQDADGNTYKEYLLLPVLHAILNQIFITQCYPDAWSTAVVTAVYKKGDHTNLDNYRAIAVGLVLSKLFAIILNTRLDGFVENRGFRAHGQAGFRHNRCTADHVFVLRHLIDKYRASYKVPCGSKLFTCFVDFRKAYDSIHRDLLMQRLAEIGIHGNMLSVLAHMYFTVPLRAKVNGDIGPLFSSACGVKQGDPLSPLLFGIFIDALEQWLLRRLPNVGAQLHTQLIQILLYADDLVLLAQSASQLQQLLDALSEFAQLNGMQVNVSKTVIVVFGRSKYTGMTTWTYNSQPVPVSPSFRYLGICFHSTKGVSAAYTPLRTAALRALRAMLGRCKQLGTVTIELKLRLYSTLVQPILEYCAEVWSPDLLSTTHTAASMLDNPLQQVHLTLLRSFANLPKSTCRILLMREFCCTPIASRWLSAVMRYYDRVRHMPTTALVPIAVAENLSLAVHLKQSTHATATTRKAVCWGLQVLNTLYALGLHHLIDAVISRYSTIHTYTDALFPLPVISTHEVLHTWDMKWLSAWQDACITDQSPRDPTVPSSYVKRTTYCRWFMTPGKKSLPDYVIHSTCIQPCKLQRLIRFRCGAHALRIQSARYDPNHQDGERSSRHCMLCSMHSIEDEYHMIFECPVYHCVRQRYAQLFSVLPEAFWHTTATTEYTSAADHRMILFMTQKCTQVAAFISECFAIRAQSLTTAGTVIHPIYTDHLDSSSNSDTDLD